MAISHLYCEEYQESYNNYLKIIELQIDFRNAIKIFFDFLREHIIQIINPTNIAEENQINSLRLLFT